MAPRLSTAGWMALGLVLGTLGTSTWLEAQSADLRREAVEERLRAQGIKIYSGSDIGFRASGVRGGVPVVVPVVRVNGEWVEVEFGGGGIKKLTK